MIAWINFLAYQAVWFAVVISAARGHAALGLAAAGSFIAVQLAVSAWRALDARLLGAALVAGVAIDGGLASLGWLRYAAASPALPPHGAPLWILALWLSFALTLTRSLAWLMRRPELGVLLGAVGAPLAYGSAAHGWHAIEFAPPATRGAAALALGWGAAMALFAVLVRRGSTAPAAAARVPASRP